MKKLITHNRNLLELEAIEWLVRLTSGETSPDESAEFASWFNRSPAHEEAFQKMTALWGNLDNPALTWQASESSSNALSHDINRSSQGFIKPKKLLISHHFVVSSIAACVLIAAAISLFPDYLQHPFADYRTHIGEQRMIALADGSIVHLNTDSILNAKLSNAVRKIDLIKGEAEFEVVHDANRPFIVTSGAINTQAIGTQFVVRYDNDQGTVTLLEGKVKSSDLRNQRSVMLKPSEQVAFQNDNFADKIHVDLTAADSWKNGRVQMNFVPLEQAIQELNRYRRGVIKIISPNLKRHKINAVIDLNHIDAWLDALAATLPVQVNRFGPVVLIRSNT